MANDSDHEKSPWHALERRKTVSKEPAQRARARFNLIRPLDEADDSKKWSAYIAQRKACNATIEELYQDDISDWDGPHPLMIQIRKGYTHVLQSIDALKNAESNKLERLADSVAPWEVDVQGDGDMEIQSAEIASRIHSVHRPAAVDVRIFYWNKPRMNSVEWHFKISYRVLDPVSAAKPRSIREGSWKPMISAELVDHGRRQWNPKEEKTFSMLGRDVRKVHDTIGMMRHAVETFRAVLFRTASSFTTTTTTIFGAQSDVPLLDTIRLVLASIGIVIDFVKPDIDMGGAINHDRYREFTDNARWCLPAAEWLAVNIRRVCNAAIPSDADFVDHAAELRYDEEDEDMSDEDEDEDEEYDVYYRDKSGTVVHTTRRGRGRGI